MRTYSQGRRDFLRTALATSSRSLAPRFAWALGSEEEHAAWYRNAKFGMFIHWGPYSLASVEASWPIMTPTAGGITEAEYRELPTRFTPTKFNPHAFVDLARGPARNTWFLQRSTTMASVCLIRPIRTIRLRRHLAVRTSSSSLRMPAREGECRWGFTIRHRTGIIRRFVIRPSWRKKTGTASLHVQSGRSIWITCNCS